MWRHIASFICPFTCLKSNIAVSGSADRYIANNTRRCDIRLGGNFSNFYAFFTLLVASSIAIPGPLGLGTVVGDKRFGVPGTLCGTHGAPGLRRRAYASFECGNITQRVGAPADIKSDGCSANAHHYYRHPGQVVAREQR